MPREPRIEFLFCNQCRWLLRTAWMAQELLTTFPAEIGEVAILPGTGGVFEIRVNDELIWSRKEQGRFPDIKELKQLVRDKIAPEKELGHSEKAAEIPSAYSALPDGMRRIFDPGLGAFISAAVFERDRLEPGATFAGPAVVVENETTTIVSDKFHVHVNGFGYLECTRTG